MKEIKTSGLPIFLSDTGKLDFKGQLVCGGSGGRYVKDVKNLLMNPEGVDEQEHCYDFYRDIVFEKDRHLYAKYGFRYDITVIMPGVVNGEYKKTSGHYHEGIEGQTYTYPEVYEVLTGRCCYILQKVQEFQNGEPVVEELKAVFVEAGQAIIIPPFYGHCSVNVSDEPMAFSNIAAVACPLDYESIQKKRGLGAYVVKQDGKPVAVPNTNYKSLPRIQVITPKENPGLGIRFGSPVYHEFVAHPEKYGFLLNPGPYSGQMEDMLAE